MNHHIMKHLYTLAFLFLLTAAAAAQTAISGYSSQGSPAASDLLVTVDVSDTSMAPAGTTKKMTLTVLDTFFSGTTQTVTNKSLSGSSNTFTNIPIATAISGLGSGVATFLATPSSANLASAVTGETGTGSLVFANSPSFITPSLGTPSGVVLTNATGLPTTGLVDGAVTTVKIGDDQVTNAKADNMAQNTVKGRITASTGDPEDLTANQLMTVALTATGNSTPITVGTQKVRQIVIVTPKTDTASGSNNPPTWSTAYSGSITTTAADSKVIVVCCTQVASPLGFGVFARLQRSGTPLVQGDAASSRIRTQMFWSFSSGGDRILAPATLIASDTPGSAASHTYDLAVTVETGGTWYINRSASDADGDYIGRGASTMFLIEVAP